MIEFWSYLTISQIATVLAACIYPGVPLEEGLPFPDPSDYPWWELSRQNDHKVDDRREADAEGRHRYTFRDRYRSEERAARVMAVLKTIGATGVRQI